MGPVTVNIDHDVWRYLMRGKGVPSNHVGYFLYDKHDFDRFASLPPHWDYCLDENGEGTRVDFPVKAKAVLAWSTKKCCVVGGELVTAPRVALEKVAVHIVKKACNINSL